MLKNYFHAFVAKKVNLATSNEIYLIFLLSYILLNFSKPSISSSVACPEDYSKRWANCIEYFLIVEKGTSSFWLLILPTETDIHVRKISWLMWIYPFDAGPFSTSRFLLGATGERWVAVVPCSARIILLFFSEIEDRSFIVNIVISV